MKLTKQPSLMTFAMVLESDEAPIERLFLVYAVEERREKRKKKKLNYILVV